MSTAARASDLGDEIVGTVARDSGRVHSLPTVSQPVRETADSHTREALDSEDTPVEINRPIWAVDLGSEMRALSTFDLWMGLSRGDLPTDVRVWRMGRECWLPAREIPELACALSERIEAEDRGELARVTLDYEAGPASGVRVAGAPGAGAPTAAEDCEALAVLDELERPAIVELDPADVMTDEPPRVAVREPRRLVRKRRVRRTLAATALGAAVLAVAAIAIGQPASPVDEHDASGLAARALTEELARAQAPALGPEESVLEGADLASPRADLELGDREEAHTISRVKRVSPGAKGQSRRRQR